MLLSLHVVVITLRIDGGSVVVIDATLGMTTVLAISTPSSDTRRSDTRHSGETSLNGAWC